MFKFKLKTESEFECSESKVTQWRDYESGLAPAGKAAAARPCRASGAPSQVDVGKSQGSLARCDRRTPDGRIQVPSHKLQVRVENPGRGASMALKGPGDSHREQRRHAAAAAARARLRRRRCGEVRPSLHWKGLLFIARETRLHIGPPRGNCSSKGY